LRLDQGGLHLAFLFSDNKAVFLICQVVAREFGEGINHAVIIFGVIAKGVLEALDIRIADDLGELGSGEEASRIMDGVAFILAEQIEREFLLGLEVGNRLLLLPPIVEAAGAWVGRSAANPGREIALRNAGLAALGEKLEDLFLWNVVFDEEIDFVAEGFGELGDFAAATGGGIVGALLHYVSARQAWSVILATT